MNSVGDACGMPACYSASSQVKKILLKLIGYCIVIYKYMNEVPVHPSTVISTNSNQPILVNAGVKEEHPLVATMTMPCDCNCGERTC